MRGAFRMLSRLSRIALSTRRCAGKASAEAKVPTSGVEQRWSAGVPSTDPARQCTTPGNRQGRKQAGADVLRGLSTPLYLSAQAPCISAELVFAATGYLPLFIQLSVSAQHPAKPWRPRLPAAWRSAARPSWPGSLLQQQLAYRRGQRLGPWLWRWPSPPRRPTSGEPGPAAQR